MQNVAVVTDSLSCIPRQMIDRYGIVMVPIRIVLRGRVYRDLVDITPSEAYKIFLEDPESFSTSPSSPGHYLEAYERARKVGKSILCITVSAKLSSSFNAAKIAGEQARVGSPDCAVEVIDSQTVTAAEGLVALAAAKVAAEGKGLTEVAKVAEEIRDKVAFFAFLDTMRHVYRTGRVPKIAADIAAFLDIKPILTTSAGLVRLKTIVRNREQGENRLLEAMRRRAADNPVHVAVMHAFAPDRAEALKRRISREFNCSEIFVTEFSPVMGYATGTGTLGIAFYADK